MKSVARRLKKQKLRYNFDEKSAVFVHQNRFTFQATNTDFRITSLTYNYSMLSSTFVDAALHLERNNNNLSHFLAKYTIRKGLRHTTYQTFLKPIFQRKNLKILMNTRVHKVNEEG